MKPIDKWLEHILTMWEARLNELETLLTTLKNKKNEL